MRAPDCPACNGLAEDHEGDHHFDALGLYRPATPAPAMPSRTELERRRPLHGPERHPTTELRAGWMPAGGGGRRRLPIQGQP